MKDSALEAVSAQQRLASDPAASVWVSASAGAGKTKVLTDRVLRLLLAGTPPHKLLCLTYTKAAAAEMANRVTSQLSGWSTMTPDALRQQIHTLTGASPDAVTLARARGLFAAVLDAPGGLKIQTIHAFCHSLLGRFPLEAGLAPHATVLDDASAALLQIDARTAVFAAACADPDSPLGQALSHLSGIVDEDGFAALIADLDKERGRSGKMLSAEQGDALTAQLAATLGVAADATEGGLVHAYCEALAPREGALKRAMTVLLESASSDDQKTGRRLDEFFATPPARRAAAFPQMQQALLTEKDTPRKRLMTKTPAARFPELLETLAAEAERLVELMQRCRSLEIFQATAALLRVGGEIIRRYQIAKQRLSALDFHDLILAVRDLLQRDGGASWVHYKLDQGIDHVLIDEAQDTSLQQWAVITHLTQDFFSGDAAGRAPRSLFAVGDFKQSIYSFQGAAPDAFHQMEQYFAGQLAPLKGQRDWRSITLDISLRSNACVLAAVNAVFNQEIMPLKGVNRHIAARAGAGGVVELWPVRTAPAEDDAPDSWTPPVERADQHDLEADTAMLVARHIWQWLTSGEILQSQGRAVEPRDFLILLNQRGSFMPKLVRRLKQVGVPVAGADRMALTDQLAVMDLMALGQFLLLPEDDLTLATVLKGPLIGLDEQALFDLACPRTGSLWRAVVTRARTDPAVRAAWQALKNWRRLADYQPPFAFYARLLTQDGGRHRLLERLGEEAADAIDEFLNQALLYEQSHAPSLQGFLHWLAATATEIKREGNSNERNEVRIMTVHGAKGLQAPIVILPDTLREQPAGAKKNKLLWPPAPSSQAPAGQTPAASFPLWSPRKASDDPVALRWRAEFETAQRHESWRLLYVALTRAQDRLYITGWHKKPAIPENCWYHWIKTGLELESDAMSVDFDFAEFDFPHWAGAGLRLVSPQTAPPESASVAATIPATPAMLPEWARRPPPPEPFQPHASPATDSGTDSETAPETEPPVRSPIDRDARDSSIFQRGRLIHRLLQSLPDLAANDRPEAARRYLASPLHALPPADQAAIAAEIFAVLAHPDFAAAFAPGSRAEVPLVGIIGRVAITARIDRLAVTDKSVYIVDFKTNRRPPLTPNQIPPVYLTQMRRYHTLIRQIYPGHTLHTALLWTDTPHLMPLPGALLA